MGCQCMSRKHEPGQSLRQAGGEAKHEKNPDFVIMQLAEFALQASNMLGLMQSFAEW